MGDFAAGLPEGFAVPLVLPPPRHDVSATAIQVNTIRTSSRENFMSPSTTNWRLSRDDVGQTNCRSTWRVHVSH